MDAGPCGVSEASQRAGAGHLAGRHAAGATQPIRSSGVLRATRTLASFRPGNCPAMTSSSDQSRAREASCDGQAAPEEQVDEETADRGCVDETSQARDPPKPPDPTSARGAAQVRSSLRALDASADLESSCSDAPLTPPPDPAVMRSQETSRFAAHGWYAVPPTVAGCRPVPVAP